MIINDPVFKILGFGLSGAYKRNEVLAQNIANADTPNYKSYDINFMSELKKALEEDRDSLPLKRTNPLHMSNIPNLSEDFKVEKRNEGTYINGNDVDPERENAMLLDNALYYESLLGSLSKEFTIWMNVVSDGKK
ncbi:MAG TPA: flagellar basal body rod protein FlgB [Thermodesulfobium narugense]|uniref:Flagellar basal body rod protein FlgB n=1 Tax=Thermodesulfobium acidiphilum TaxID=1794699 RepID=A0A2R4VY00_THEAF|nr:flagellar basal body rod protein FlgB [Thermodesulfobium acidiphilum]AWB09419.1 flagellar basal-body rod protein FlgB [Thermodesulfobium acidiphilum]PMP86164.1 MAG: flagellar basal body rod protein FlgB [Thermodesulfobium narugense]HEM56063.1 flagellar basal body rod protein FlgB [Thermodesulfobium narugense]